MKKFSDLVRIDKRATKGKPQQIGRIVPVKKKRTAGQVVYIK